jgi:hypothetical protein
MVYPSYYGDMITTDLVRHIAAIGKHPDFNPDFDELIEATGVTSFQVPSDHVRGWLPSIVHFMRMRGESLPQRKIWSFGLGRMFQTFGNEQRPHFLVVRTLEQACRRLGRERLPKASSGSGA